MRPLPLYEASAGRFKLSYALEDVKEGLRRHAIWRELARRDIYNRTKGARLGRWWIIIAQAAAIAGIGLVYGRLFALSLQEYLPYLAVGLITWGYISSLINEAPDIFTYSKGFLMQARMPLSVCVFRLVARSLVIFSHKVLIIFAVIGIFQVPLGWSSLIALIGVLLISIAGFFTGVIIGFLNARYRDIGQFVTSFSIFLFFMTPVFWKAERLAEYRWVVDYNPLYHFVNLVRFPLIGEPVTGWSFAMTGGSIAILVVIAAIVYRSLGREIIYWL